MSRDDIIRKIVADLNDNFLYKTDETEYLPFEYFDHGIGFGMKFMGIIIYSSDNNSEYHETEDRELTIEEIIDEVKKEVNIILSSLKKWELE